MSKKNKDKKNRWRKKTIAFRVSNEENEMIDEMVSMSGMKKQDYLTSNMLHKDIKVTPNVRMFKGLKDTLISMTDELRRIEGGNSVDEELMEMISTALSIIKQMKKRENFREICGSHFLFYTYFRKKLSKLPILLF